MIVCGILALAGIIFFSIGIGFLLHVKNRKEKCNGTAAATVVEIRAHAGMDGDTIYKPVLEFYVCGAYIKNTYSVGSNPCPYYVGQSVTVRYDINNPIKYYIEGEKATIIMGIVFTLIGAISVVIGIVIFLRLF